MTLHIENSPDYRGEWASVMLEPITGSGERLTICVAALGHDGAFKVVSTIPNKAAKCLYGEKAAYLLELVDWTVASFRQHLESTHAVAGWRAPLEGISVGLHKQARDWDLRGILNQAITQAASLGRLVDDESEEKEQRQFGSVVKQTLLGIDENYKDTFDQPIRTSRNARAKTYGLVTRNYIANYGAVSNYTASYNAAIAKMTDIHDLILDQFTLVDRLEVVIAPPEGFYTNPLVHDGSRESQRDRMEQVREECEKRDIPCEILESPVEVALHLHRRAAA